MKDLAQWATILIYLAITLIAAGLALSTPRPRAVYLAAAIVGLVATLLVAIAVFAT